MFKAIKGIVAAEVTTGVGTSVGGTTPSASEVAVDLLCEQAVRRFHNGTYSDDANVFFLDVYGVFWEMHQRPVAYRPVVKALQRNYLAWVEQSLHILDRLDRTYEQGEVSIDHVGFILTGNNMAPEQARKRLLSYLMYYNADKRKAYKIDDVIKEAETVMPHLAAINIFDLVYAKLFALKDGIVPSMTRE